MSQLSSEGKARLSLGENRVRINFNVDDNSEVTKIKEATAKLINLCEEFRTENPSEKSRLLSLAQTAYEEAAMWAVKAVTG